MTSKIKVLVVDDSAVVRQVVSAMLAADPEIVVMGAVSDPIFALERMKTELPNVIVLDVEMPRMDGITFLKKIMSERPIPVVICSTLTERGAETTMEAMSAGAVSIVTKPKMGLKKFLEDSADDLVTAVKAASRANVRRLVSPVRPIVETVTVGGGVQAMTQTTHKVIAIGTSTGGTQALEYVLAALPRVCPPIVIVQHMPEKFTAAFAARLNGLSQIEVKEAANNDRVIPGRALIAPGGQHMILKRSGAQYYVEVVAGPLVNRHRPSVDVLFRSTAVCAGKNAVGIIMTGMGDDGARGLKEMHEAGAYTIAQDEATCVVYGMPKEAVKLGAADRILPIQSIPQEILVRGRM